LSGERRERKVFHPWLTLQAQREGAAAQFLLVVSELAHSSFPGSRGEKMQLPPPVAPIVPVTLVAPGHGCR
jgi:hypothetical protein